MNGEDKRGIFFGVVGVLTLIVAIIGASLAYFSINARSKDDAVRVEAATVKIVYEDGDKLLVGNNIIPATQAIATRTFERYLSKEQYTDKTSQEKVYYSKCVDDNGYNVCGAYNFSLTNSGPTATTITMTIKPTTPKNEDGEPLTEYTKFKNLRYALYNVTGVAEDTYPTSDGTTTDYKELGTLVKSDALSITTDSEGKVTGYNDTIVIDYNEDEPSKNITINSNETKVYRLFVWLNETSTELESIPQDYEQGAVFQGAISIDVVGANNSQITGSAS